MATNFKYPDIHLNSGYLPYVRKHNGDLEPLEKLIINEEEVLLSELHTKQVEDFLEEMCGIDSLKKLLATQELDSSYSFFGVRELTKYRLNCYIDSKWLSIAMRLIPSVIPTLDDLSLWETVKKMCDKQKGLILITGPTGSWKSTNLAAMVDYINQTYKKHIITIEDPIEFTFQSKKSLINQREIGKHTKWFTSAMRATLREDPDVIVIGEMRDSQTIKTAITLAETGHLVISTLHTNDTVQSVDRIIDIFPWAQQWQIRMQLAMSLVGIISQRLIVNKVHTWRIAAREILLNSDAVRSLIIEWKTHQIYAVLEVAWSEWMILLDKSLVYLYNSNQIDYDTLISYARDKEIVAMMIQKK